MLYLHPLNATTLMPATTCSSDDPWALRGPIDRLVTPQVRSRMCRMEVGTTVLWCHEWGTHCHAHAFST